MRSVNFLDSHVSLHDVESKFLGVSEVYYIDFAIQVEQSLNIVFTFPKFNQIPYTK